MPATETQTKIKPLGDRVVLEVIDQAEQTSGGIYLPEAAREKPQMALVLAVGPGPIVEGKRQEMQVKVGDKVLFAKYSGTDYKLGDKEVKIVSEKDILGIIEA